MSEHTEIIDRYFQAWNEPDAGKRQALLEAAFAVDGRYQDPAAGAESPAGIAAMMGAVQERFPGHVVARDGDIDAHNGQGRFDWTLGQAGAEPILKGIDVVTFDADGKLQSVIGFFDHVAIPQAA